MWWHTVTHGRGSEGETGVGSQYSHKTSEGGVSSITNADAHTSAASSRLSWLPLRFKWTHPFRRKTKSGFCACAIRFRTSSTAACLSSVWLCKLSHAKLKLIFFVAAFWEAMLSLAFSLLADSAVLFAHCRDQRMSGTLQLFSEPRRNASQGWYNPSTLTVATKFLKNLDCTAHVMRHFVFFLMYPIRQSLSWQADSRPDDQIHGVLRNSEVRCRLRQPYESDRFVHNFFKNRFLGAFARLL